ncbi:MAG TPA: CarD family transcriptional regulator, partial [Vicinamibacterales bacterium]
MRLLALTGFVRSSTSLSLRALFRSAAARAGLDADAGRLAGLTPAAQALYAAARAHAAPGDLVVAVVPTDADVEQLTGDARYFLDALEGLGESAAEQAVVPLPSHEVDPYRGLAPHLQVASARAHALAGIASGDARLVVVSASALLPRLIPPDRLAGAVLELRAGVEIDPHDLASRLVDAGFTREDPVDQHGEFCVRGGIVDIFQPGDSDPVRIEFIGDTIESLRRYDPATQRSTGTIDQVRILPIRERLGDGDAPAAANPGLDATVFEYLTFRRRLAPILIEPDDVRAEIERFLEQITASHQALVTGERAPRGQMPPDVAPPEQLFLDADTVMSRLAGAVRVEQLAVDPEGVQAPHQARHVRCQPALEYHGRVPDWIADVRRARDAGETVVFVAASPGRAERMLEIARDYQIVAVPAERAEDAHAAALVVAIGRLSRGFRLADGGLAIYAETDLFEEERRAPETRKRQANRAFLSDLRDLKVGDYVVHVDHGIGVFVGLRQIPVGPGEPQQEFMELRYAGDDKLFVPVERLDLVQKYTGGTRPSVDRLGGTTWARAKTRVKKAMRDMAEELLKLYAARKAVPGHAFSPDTHWQQEFEDAFPYELTPDQQTAIADIKRDMEAPVPMDRLLCGDVGYGKTEVAMRAVFRAVQGGKQACLLAPTTVLVEQHYRTMTERFKGFGLEIGKLSRFQARGEQIETVKKLSEGKLDVVVGTHRLLSPDVRFKDLGLL